MTDSLVLTASAMSTVVSIRIVGHGASEAERQARADGMTRAMGWFEHVEATCSRFDAQSELRQLSAQVGIPVAVSPLLFHAVQFAIAVAEDSDGAFDPTVGRRMEALGFNREHRTATAINSPFDDVAVSYRDVFLDADANTITLQQPLVLDLGAVAKGLAIDCAARELAPFEHFAIDAGGDLYLGGNNPEGEPWTIAVRHPRDTDCAIDTLRVRDRAVCTSGDYERRIDVDGALDASRHHLLDGRTGRAANALASVTVIAPSAMVADALATAAFALGPSDGAALLARHGVDALLVTPILECRTVGVLSHA